MIIGLALIAAVIAIALFAAGQARPRSADRDLKRRGRQLHRNPARARYVDVERLFRHELSAGVSKEICRVAEAREVPPDMLWSWAEAHGTALLAIALCAGFDRRELALTTPSDSELDRESLEMHAELNDCLFGALVVRAVRPVEVAGHHRSTRSSSHSGGRGVTS